MRNPLDSASIASLILSYGMLPCRVPQFTEPRLARRALPPLCINFGRSTMRTFVSAVAAPLCVAGPTGHRCSLDRERHGRNQELASGA